MRRTFCFFVIVHCIWHTLFNNTNSTRTVCNTRDWHTAGAQNTVHTQNTVVKQRASCSNINTPRTNERTVNSNVVAQKSHTPWISSSSHSGERGKKENMVERTEIITWTHIHMHAHKQTHAHSSEIERKRYGACMHACTVLHLLDFFLLRQFCTAHALTCSQPLDITSVAC